MDFNKLKGQLSKDNLALIVGGIFVLGLIFSAYTYFKSGSNVEDNIKKNAQRVEDIISSKTERDTAVITNNATKNDQKAVLSTGTDNTESTVWTANQYSEGDIKSGSYTVNSGDTLWQIAVAVYGDGTQWTKILAANSGSIEFLPDGSQALIVTGQVLLIP